GGQECAEVVHPLHVVEPAAAVADGMQPVVDGAELLERADGQGAPFHAGLVRMGYASARKQSGARKGKGNGPEQDAERERGTRAHVKSPTRSAPSSTTMNCGTGSHWARVVRRRT